MIVIELLLLGAILQKETDECVKVKNPAPVTSWAEVELAERFSVRRLKGEVLDGNGSPLSNARIEVVKLASSGKGRLLKVCTAVTSRFSFDRLSKGHYELRFSLEGYDRTIVKIVVSKAEPAKGEVRVVMKASN